MHAFDTGAGNLLLHIHFSQRRYITFQNACLSLCWPAVRVYAVMQAGICKCIWAYMSLYGCRMCRETNETYTLGTVYVRAYVIVHLYIQIYIYIFNPSEQQPSPSGSPHKFNGARNKRKNQEVPREGSRRPKKRSSFLFERRARGLLTKEFVL